MQRPTTNSNYTKDDLRKYAQYRKEREMQRLELLNDIEDSEERDQSEENREALALDVRKVIDICLSTGGDADGYKLTFDKDNELMSGVYYWADWGVYEEVNLKDDELDSIYDLYLFGDVSSFLG